MFYYALKITTTIFEAVKLLQIVIDVAQQGRAKGELPARGCLKLLQFSFAHFHLCS
jgi:hypothetical protein